MDDPALGGDEHAQALRGLARVHRLTGTAQRLWRSIRRRLELSDSAPLRVMDVGCGDALLLRQLFRLARRDGVSLQPIGCDFSSRALELAAAAASRQEVPLELHQVDVTSQALPGPADIVLCSLFLHHFSEAQVVDILRQLAAAAQRLVILEDLLRSQLGYCLCWIGVHGLSRSRVVHVDGLRSVRAAFTIAEVRGLLASAGLQSAAVTKHWPERWFVEWSPESQHTDA